MEKKDSEEVPFLFYYSLILLFSCLLSFSPCKIITFSPNVQETRLLRGKDTASFLQGEGFLILSAVAGEVWYYEDICKCKGLKCSIFVHLFVDME